MEVAVGESTVGVNHDGVFRLLQPGGFVMRVRAYGGCPGSCVSRYLPA